MSDSLDTILQQLDASYNPARQAINDRIGQLQGQADSQISGLNAQKDSAFNDITNGARDRGMGFSGIPLAEQAKYTATDFLPAVAKVRQSQNDARSSLTDAINNLGIDQRKTAFGIQQGQQQMDFQREQQAAAERAAAAARQASAGAGVGGFGLGSGGGGAAPQPQQAKPKTDPLQQDAYNDVKTRIAHMTPAQIKSDYAATAKSAGFGNVRDKYKLEFYSQLRPDLFGGGVSANALANGGQLRF
jgi:hypothetical protein